MSWDVRDKIILVTGATNGIGLEAAVKLGRMGARLTLVGRDPGRTQAAVDAVKTRGGASEVRSLLCDFSSQAAIRKLAGEVLETHPRIDVLVNNAGTVYKTRTLTVDGIEATFAVNHLGYFLLTHLLLDRIVASAPARIVNVASVGHRRGTMDFDDLGFERRYSILRAYTRSKLANILFTNELARRLDGKGVTANSLHPGNVATNIWSGAPGWSKPLLALVVFPFSITAEQGAEPIVRLASDPALDGVTGTYSERARKIEPAPLARDAKLGARLWEVSAKMVGLPAS